MSLDRLSNSILYYNLNILTSPGLLALFLNPHALTAMTMTMIHESSSMGCYLQHNHSDREWMIPLIEQTCLQPISGFRAWFFPHGNVVTIYQGLQYTSKSLILCFCQLHLSSLSTIELHLDACCSYNHALNYNKSPKLLKDGSNGNNCSFYRP